MITLLTLELKCLNQKKQLLNLNGRNHLNQKDIDHVQNQSLHIEKEIAKMKI